MDARCTRFIQFGPKIVQLVIGPVAARAAQLVRQPLWRALPAGRPARPLRPPLILDVRFCPVKTGRHRESRPNTRRSFGGAGPWPSAASTR